MCGDTIENMDFVKKKATHIMICTKLENMAYSIIFSNTSHMVDTPRWIEKNNWMTLEKLQILWNTAVRTGDQSDIEFYAEWVELFAQTLYALQELDLIHGGEEWWSWLTRTLNASLNDWREEEIYTLHQAQRLNIDFRSILALTEWIQVDALIGENRERVRKILN